MGKMHKNEQGAEQRTIRRNVADSNAQQNHRFGEGRESVKQAIEDEFGSDVFPPYDRNITQLLAGNLLHTRSVERDGDFAKFTGNLGSLIGSICRTLAIAAVPLPNMDIYTDLFTFTRDDDTATLTVTGLRSFEPDRKGKNGSGPEDEGEDEADLDEEDDEEDEDDLDEEDDEEDEDEDDLDEEDEDEDDLDEEDEYEDDFDEEEDGDPVVHHCSDVDCGDCDDRVTCPYSDFEAMKQRVRARLAEDEERLRSYAG